MRTGAHYVGYLAVKSSQMNSDFSLLYTWHIRESAFVGEAFCVYSYSTVHIHTMKILIVHYTARSLLKGVSNISNLTQTYVHSDTEAAHPHLSGLQALRYIIFSKFTF